MSTHFFSVFVVGRKILDSGESRDVIAVGEMQDSSTADEVRFDRKLNTFTLRTIGLSYTV